MTPDELKNQYSVPLNYFRALHDEIHRLPASAKSTLISKKEWRFLRKVQSLFSGSRRVYVCLSDKFDYTTTSRKS